MTWDDPQPPPPGGPLGPQGGTPRSGTRLDPARLWSGGAATALAAGLTAVVGILVIRWLLDVPVLAPRGDGAWGNANTLTYALVTAAVALAATALVQLLAATTPNYTRFFNWIMMLVTAIAVVLPLSLGASLGSRIATAVLNLVLGLSITSALGGVARRATVRTGPEQWS